MRCRDNCKTFPAWALAARIVFAISPNSASCERVFALLKNLFGEEQSLSLADYVQASLMLNYNEDPTVLRLMNRALPRLLY